MTRSGGLVADEVTRLHVLHEFWRRGSRRRRGKRVVTTAVAHTYIRSTSRIVAFASESFASRRGDRDDRRGCLNADPRRELM